MKKLSLLQLWIGLELLIALVLFLVLPQQIHLNFWWLMTNQNKTGASWNIFALPVLLIIVQILQNAVDKYDLRLSELMKLLTLLAILSTSFLLLQVSFVQ
ncbi:MAG: hypothetical protein ACI31W_02620 [Lactococcus sp.]